MTFYFYFVTLKNTSTQTQRIPKLYQNETKLANESSKYILLIFIAIPSPSFFRPRLDSEPVASCLYLDIIILTNEKKKQPHDRK